MYPLYLVAATSAALYGLGASLVRAGRAPRWCGWILQCLAAAKLSVVFIGEDPVVLQVGKGDCEEIEIVKMLLWFSSTSCLYLEVFSFTYAFFSLLPFFLLLS